MVHLAMEIGKLLNILLIAFYTFLSLRSVLKLGDKSKKRVYILMTVLFYTLHLDINALIYIYTGDTGIIIFYAAQLLVYILVQIMYGRCYKNMNKAVFRNMLFLLMLGICMLTRLDLMTAVKQFIIMTIALIVGLVVPVMIEKLEIWGRLGLVYVLVGLAVMAVLLLLGSEQYGATNWIIIGPLSIQPSEFVKLLFVFGMAAMLLKNKTFKGLVITTALAAAHVIVLVLEHDLGAALIFYITYVVMLYIATHKVGWLLAGSFAGIAAAIFSYFAFSHVQVRVQAFIDPLAEYDTKGYQIAQSLFAIGSGKWFGTGLYQGSPKSIPVASSDFIFSAITEEMGAIFSICLIIIMLSIFIMFINISMKIENNFFRLVALGLGSLYITQVFVNVGGVTKFIPSSGVTLPLVSAGGSSLIASVLMFNVIQGLYCKAVDTGPTEYGSERAGEVESMIDAGRVKRLLGVTYFFSGLIVLTVGYLCYFIALGSHDFCLDSRNARQNLLAKNVIRGDILTADGKVIATTEIEDGEEIRTYPYKNMFCHIGGRYANGKTGVELLGNSELLSSDINGFKKIENDLNNLKNPGNNVVTTLNYKLQKAAYDALGDMKGAVVVLEPKTGKVLAMVSKPDYDPNTVEKNWEKLNKDEDDSHRLLNRATTGLYQPGSTFKVLTLLEYMRENKNYEDFKFSCEGETRVNGVTVHCAAGLVHGKETLESAFANSCNSAFATIGCSLDMDRMRTLAESFLFNGKLPGPLTDKSGEFALSGKSEDIDIPQSIIGLSTTLVTPLHNALIAATIANDGVMMTPYVIDHIENANGGTVSTKKPEKYYRIIFEEEAKKLNEYMCAVVEDGTGSKLSSFSFKVAGKTGTATYDKDQNAHAWFIGFAPADDPEIAISVVCESAGSGSKYAVPVAKKILEAWEKLRGK